MLIIILVEDKEIAMHVVGHFSLCKFVNTKRERDSSTERKKGVLIYHKIIHCPSGLLTRSHSP